MIIRRKFKICKRVGDRVFNKCQTPAFSRQLMSRSRGNKKRPPRPLSEYGLQLKEKQKARYTYLMNEKQFANSVKAATTKKGVKPSQYLFKLLESRLDNVVYRLGFAPSRAAARQAVSHGHITVNEKKISIPSYQVSLGDKIGIRKGSADKKVFAELREKLKNFHTPKWTKIDLDKMTGEIVGDPVVEEGATTVNLNVVLEYYSR